MPYVTSYASTWVAKARDVIEAWEAGTPNYYLPPAECDSDLGTYLILEIVELIIAAELVSNGLSLWNG